MELTALLISQPLKKGLCFSFLILYLCASCICCSQQNIIAYNDSSIAWLNGHLVGVNNPTPESAPKENRLAEFGNWVNKALIVGLGEDTHGTKEFYQLKLELIKYLITEKQFSLVAIEDNLPEISKLNQLLLGPDTNDQEYRKYLSEHLQYKEYFELFHWLRHYNQGTQNKVLLYGMDMQSARVAKDIVSDIVRPSKNQRLMEKAERLRERLDEVYLYIDRKKQASAEDRKKRMRLVLHESRSLLRSAKNQRNTIIATSSARQYNWLIKNLETIIAFTKFTAGIHTPVINTAINRDMQMADNVDWILKQHPGQKIIVWAHNGHVHKDLHMGEGMGYFIKKKHGSGYFSVGLLSALGQYGAMNPQTRKQEVYTLPELSTDSWNGLFQSLGKSFFYLKTDEGFHAALNYALKVRGIGLQATDKNHQYYITKNLDYLFDCVFFIGETTAATHLSLIP